MYTLYDGESEETDVHLTVMLPQTNKAASPQAIRDIASAAEELGFFGITVHDHLVFNGWWVVSGMRGFEGPGDDRDLFEALETLGYVAAITDRIRLSVSVVVVSMRKPVALAKQVATIDALSGGRLRLGVGVGPPLKPMERETTQLGAHRANARREYDASGLRGERGRRTDEYLRAMIEIWTTDKASFEGEFVSFEDIEVFPKPVQEPYPPLFVGGRSDHALRRAARFGAGWVPSQVSVEEVAAGRTRLADLYEQHSVDGAAEIVVNLPVVLADSDEAAQAVARPTARPLFPGEQEFNERTIVGSPAVFAARLREYRDAGVSNVELKPLYPDLDNFIWQLETLQSEVVPMLAD